MCLAHGQVPNTSYYPGPNTVCISQHRLNYATAKRSPKSECLKAPKAILLHATHPCHVDWGWGSQAYWAAAMLNVNLTVTVPKVTYQQLNDPEVVDLILAQDSLGGLSYMAPSNEGSKKYPPL